MSQVRFAFKDIIRNLAAVLLFMGLLAFTTNYLAIFVNEFLLFRDILAQIDKLQEHEIINFDVIHPGELQIESEMAHLLARTLDAKNTDYYVVIEQLNLSPQLGKLGIPLYYGFGQFGEVFALDPGGLRDPDVPFTVLIGAKVRGLDVGDVVTLGDSFSKSIDAPVVGRLPHNSSFLRQGGHFIDYLDEAIVVLTSFSTWRNHHLLDTGSLLQSLHFIDKLDKDISDFVNSIEKISTYKIRPRNFNDQIREGSLIFRNSAARLIALYSLTFILVSTSIVSNLLMLMERNLREYAIHRIYGATLRDLYLRTLIYIALIVLPPFIMGYWRLLRTPYTLVPPQSKLILLIMTILTIGITSIYPMIKLKKQDVIADLRRE